MFKKSISSNKMNLVYTVIIPVPSPEYFRKILFLMLGSLLMLHIFSECLLRYSESKLFLLFAKSVNFNTESNLPTLFNFSLLFLSVSILVIISIISFNRNDPLKIYWLVLAVTFLMMSFDEAAQLHEKLNFVVRSTIPVSGFLFYAWVVPVGIFVIVFGLSYISFLKRLPLEISGMIILGGSLYILGAIGLEMIAGNLASADRSAIDTIPWRVAMTLEETFEMSGIIIFASSLIAYLRLNPNKDDTF